MKLRYKNDVRKSGGQFSENIAGHLTLSLYPRYRIVTEWTLTKATGSHRYKAKKTRERAHTPCARIVFSLFDLARDRSSCAQRRPHLLANRKRYVIVGGHFRPTAMLEPRALHPREKGAAATVRRWIYGINYRRSPAFFFPLSLLSLSLRHREARTEHDMARKSRSV